MNVMRKSEKVVRQKTEGRNWKRKVQWESYIRTASRRVTRIFFPVNGRGMRGREENGQILKEIDLKLRLAINRLSITISIKAPQ